MKFKLEFDLPELEKVSVPIRYMTPIGEVSDLEHVNAIRDLIEYLKRLSDINWIINSDHQHVRNPFCREIIRNRLRFLEQHRIWGVGENLSHFLMSFRKFSGRSFDDYNFETNVVSNGEKFRFEGTSAVFDTEEEAIRFAVALHISQKDTPLKIER